MDLGDWKKTWATLCSMSWVGCWTEKLSFLSFNDWAGRTWLCDWGWTWRFEKSCIFSAMCLKKITQHNFAMGSWEWEQKHINDGTPCSGLGFGFTKKHVFCTCSELGVWGYKRLCLLPMSEPRISSFLLPVGQILGW